MRFFILVAKEDRKEKEKRNWVRIEKETKN